MREIATSCKACRGCLNSAVSNSATHFCNARGELTLLICLKAKKSVYLNALLMVRSKVCLQRVWCVIVVQWIYTLYLLNLWVLSNA